MQDTSIILAAYREALLAVHENGLSGPKAALTAIRAAAKISSHMLGRTISEEEVRRQLADKD